MTPIRTALGKTADLQLRGARNLLSSGASHGATIALLQQSVSTPTAMRTSPNIIITGTPGVGKTTHSELLAQKTGLKYLSINQIAKERDCHESYDDELKTWIVDEDKVHCPSPSTAPLHPAPALTALPPQLLDALEPDVQRGGCILDWHACDLFPKSWIDLVVVVRCDSTALYDRLAARGYGPRKLEQNMDAEIMQVLLEEARGAYDEEIVVELRSDEAEDVRANVERIETWVRNWKKDHGEREGET